MKLTKKSLISGNENTRDIPITEQQYRDWQSGMRLVQDAFPHLTANDREFMMTGITPQEWDSEFKEEE